MAVGVSDDQLAQAVEASNQSIPAPPSDSQAVVLVSSSVAVKEAPLTEEKKNPPLLDTPRGYGGKIRSNDHLSKIAHELAGYARR